MVSTRSSENKEPEGSPHRKQRIQEKEEFSSLNTRLERYILAVREREAGSTHNEAISLTEDLQERLTRVADDYEEKIMELRSQQEQASAQNTELLRQFERERKLRIHAEKALEDARLKRDELQKHLVVVNQKAHENEAAAKEAEQTKRDLELKLKQTEKEIESLRNEIQRLTEESRNVNSELIELRSRHNSSAEVFRQTERRLNDSIASMQNELEQLRPANEDLEQRIRSEMNEQTRRLVEEARNSMEESKTSALEEQEYVFRAKVGDLLGRLSETESILDTTRSRNSELEQRLETSEQEMAAQDRRIAALQSEIEHLRREIASLSIRPMEGAEEREAELESLRGQVQSLRSELADLLPLRVPLEHAIQVSFYRIESY